MAAFDQERGVLQTKGMVWDRTDGHWTRYLLRRYEDGRPYWSKVSYVDPRYPICPWCLSQQVLWEKDTSTFDHDYYRCEGCQDDFIIERH